MSKADIFILLVVAAGAWSGYREGFLMELISLVAVITGIFAGFKLMGEGMLLLEDKFNADKSTLPYISFLVIFVIVVLLVSLMGRVIKHSIDKNFLGTVDQAMGAGLGAFRVLFMLSIAIWIFDSLKMKLPVDWVEDSFLFPFTSHLAPSVAGWLGDLIPPFREIFRQF